MDIGEAVQALKDGEMVTRAGWNGKGMWLELERTQTLIDNRLLLPHVILSNPIGDLVPWVASQEDLLAVDWAVV